MNKTEAIHFIGVELPKNRITRSLYQFHRDFKPLSSLPWNPVKALHQVAKRVGQLVLAFFVYPSLILISLIGGKKLKGTSKPSHPSVDPTQDKQPATKPPLIPNDQSVSTVTPNPVHHLKVPGLEEVLAPNLAKKATNSKKKTLAACKDQAVVPDFILKVSKTWTVPLEKMPISLPESIIPGMERSLPIFTKLLDSRNLGSQEIIDFIAKQSDVYFFTYSLILSALDEKTAKTLFEDPRLSFRFLQSDSAHYIKNILDVVLHVIQKNPEILKNKLAVNLFATQLANIIALGMIPEEGDIQIDSQQYIQLDRLSKDNAIPLSIRSKLNQLCNWTAMKTDADQLIESGEKHVTRAQRSVFKQHGLTDEKKLAIQASRSVEGYESRENGIRDRFHLKPGPQNIPFVMKHIAEFRTGRRTFVFQNQKDPVNPANYKAVMLYILNGLKEDKAKYYKKHPNYINNDDRNQLKQLLDGTLNDWKAKDKVVFECYSEQLFGLQKKVEEASSPEDIFKVAGEFRQIYRKIPNFNQNLTVVTCIHPYGLDPDWELKPVLCTQPCNGPPDSLVTLAEKITPTNPLKKVFDRFNALCLSPFVTGQKVVREIESWLENFNPDDLSKLNIPTTLQLLNMIQQTGDVNFEGIKKLILSFLPYTRERVRKTREICHLYITEVIDDIPNMWKPVPGLSPSKKRDARYAILKELYEKELLPFKGELERFISTLDKALNAPHTVFAFPELQSEYEKILEKWDAFNQWPHDQRLDINPAKEIEAVKKWMHPSMDPFLPRMDQMEFAVNDLKDFMNNFGYIDPELLKAEAVVLNALSQSEFYNDDDENSKPHSLSDHFIQAIEILQAVGALRATILKKLENCDPRSNKMMEGQKVLRALEKVQVAALLHKSSQAGGEYALQLALKVAQEQQLWPQGIPVPTYNQKTDLPNVKSCLTMARNQMLEGYEHLKVKLLNSPFVERMLPPNRSIDSAHNILMGNMNSGVLGTISGIIEKIEKMEKVVGAGLAGEGSEEQYVFGLVKVVQSLEYFSMADPGTILVVSSLPAEPYKYAQAGAVISEEGGILSHAAINLKESHIPSVIGAFDARKKLLEFDKRFVAIHIQKGSGVHTITSLGYSESALIESFSRKENLTPEDVIDVLSKLDTQVSDVNLKGVITSYVRDHVLRKFTKSGLKNLIQALKVNGKHNDFLELLSTSIQTKLKKAVQRFEAATSLLEKRWILQELKKYEAVLDELDLVIEYESAIPLSAEQPIRAISKGDSLMALQEEVQQIPSDENFTLSVPKYIFLKAVDFADSFYAQKIGEKSLKETISEILLSEKMTGEKAGEIQRLIGSASLPMELVECLTKARNDLCLGDRDAQVIIRSSSPIEDQSHFAAAGLFQSFVNQDPKEVYNDVKKVLASAFSEAVLNLSGFNKLSIHKNYFESLANPGPDLDKLACIEPLFKMGIIIQQYVEKGDFSGVGFSVLDSGNWDQAGLQYIEGLGGGVDGKKTPHLATFDRPLGVLTTDNGSKGYQKKYLRNAEKRYIASVVKQLEKIRGYPVDVEWVARQEHDHLFLDIVQCRPISTLSL